MAKAAVNLQDGFLNQVRKDGAEVKFVLVDGSSLIGIVRGFDNFTVVVQSRNANHLIYKHAISQIMQRRSQDKKDALAEEFADSQGTAQPAANPPAAAATPTPGRPATPSKPVTGSRPSAPSRPATAKPGAPSKPATNAPAAPKPPSFNTIDLGGLHLSKSK